MSAPASHGSLVALTGGTGFVGRATIEALLRAGCEVRALARAKQVPRSGVDWVPGDLADTAALARLVDGASAVVHVAGVVNAPDAAGFEHGNVAGTLNVLEAASRAGVPRLVHVSSLAAREPELSLYGASKARAERLVAASGLDWTMVRPPGVYGPRDTDFLELFRLARRGVVPVPRGCRASLIHVDDLARLLAALLPSGEAVTRRTFEPDDGRPDGWTTRELGTAIGAALGRRPWVIELSRPMLERVARIDQRVRGPRARLTLDRVSYMTHPDWTADPAAQPPGALWFPLVPTLQGLKTTAEWYRAEGWL